MSNDSRTTSAADAADSILGAASALFEEVLDAARLRTDGGKALDEHQVLTQRVAYLATELQAARSLLSHVRTLESADDDDSLAGPIALAFVAEIAHHLRSQLEGALEEHGIAQERIDRSLGSPDARLLIRRGLATSLLCTIGRHTVVTRGLQRPWLADETAALARTTVHTFARSEVAPLAEQLHRSDALVPEPLIRQMATLGFFAASIPERYGGTGLGYPIMAITTEELSTASLVVGSLSTRPEILARALLQGGTEAQRQMWLPRIASGDVMVAVSVTEPDVGSDVASVATRATPGVIDDRSGYLINGAKAWSTFAGRADVLALLARTDPDVRLGARGLSLFIVPKDAYFGHDFQERQAHGGLLSGTAIATPGYRGMHSYMLSFDNVFVPAENLVGEEEGLGRGFYLQMGGFAAGRLQTGARATGVAQAALEKTAEYVTVRRQFNRPIGEYGLTEYKLGRMTAQIAAARQLTYTAASAMEAAEHATATAVRSADLLAAMAKLFASDVAVWATQEAQLLHGGWGYAEESPISRYVVDAQVLPIFEGAKPILELRVIGQALLRG